MLHLQTIVQDCVILLFCNRLKTLKKEIKIAEQEAEDRKKKKQEMTKSSATKPKRLGKHQYPTVHVHALCTSPLPATIGDWVTRGNRGSG